MKRFKYKTESYLKFVKFERTKALKLLKEAENYKRALVNKYNYLESEMSRAYNINSKFGKNIHDVNFINDNNRFILKIKDQMQSLSQQIMIAEEEFKKRLQKLKNLQVQVRKIELHKELEKNKHKKEVKRKTQKQLDEINTSRRWS